jgi:uncharacterized membrane protein YsdA (DUF1294 family)
MAQFSITPGTPEFLLLCLAAYLLLANLLALIAFVVDGRRARNGDPRVPETVFLFVASFGGWFGAALGQVLCSHGVRARPLGVMLHVCGMILPAALVTALVISDPQHAVARAQAFAQQLIAPEPQGPEEVVLGGSSGGKTRLPQPPRRFGPGTDNLPLFHN